MTNETTNDSKAPKVTFGRCQAVPRQTAKETSGQCPRMVTTQNEHGLCGGHLNFLSRGAEIKLQNGTVLNPKPAATPKAPKVEEQGTRVDLSAPEPGAPAATFNAATAETIAAANGDKPPVDSTVTPKPKKVSKAKKAADALATLHAKDAQRADQAPGN